ARLSDFIVFVPQSAAFSSFQTVPLRRDKGGELHQELTTELPARVGQPPPLLLGRIAEPLAVGMDIELLPEDFVWALRCCRR
ncbi:MAG: hypothetical protein JW942_06135, partial [Opitutales bacterium]|nr:hypothetical protein [Opitutales bacterium]